MPELGFELAVSTARRPRPSPQTAWQSTQRTLFIQLTYCLYHFSASRKSYCRFLRLRDFRAGRWERLQDDNRHSYSWTVLSRERMASGGVSVLRTSLYSTLALLLLRHPWNSPNKEQSSITSRNCIVNSCGLLFFGSVCLVLPDATFQLRVFSCHILFYICTLYIRNFRNRPVGRKVRWKQLKSGCVPSPFMKLEISSDQHVRPAIFNDTCTVA